MRKSLTRQGNSKALILDRALLELLHIEGEVEITTNGHSLLITPVRPGLDADTAARLERLEADFAPLFKRLAQ